jgi:gluconolactonase
MKSAIRLALVLFVTTGENGLAGSPENPRVVSYDARMSQLVPQNTRIEKVADGFAWVEGPVWDKKARYLLFSDIPNNSIFSWKDGKGITLYLKPSGYSGKEPFTGREPGSNGLTFDHQGRLLLCEHGDRRISRLEADGSKTTLADRYKGRRLNSPNDLMVKSNGDIYFTDPPFGLPGAFDDPGRELDFCGVYKLSTNGDLTLLTKELEAPNGIAFSPDEKILYVSDSGRRLWMAFDVKDDGTIASGRVLLDGSNLGTDEPGVPDGMEVDIHGNIFGAAPGGLYVIASDGTLLGMIDFGVATGNCTWGEDGSTLFVTANTAVYRIRVSTKGVGFGG